jgi:hypothetical protein
MELESTGMRVHSRESWTLNVTNIIRLSIQRKRKGHATSFRRRKYCELSEAREFVYMVAVAKVVVTPTHKSQIEIMQPQSRVPSGNGSWKAAGIVDAGRMNTPTH